MTFQLSAPFPLSFSELFFALVPLFPLTTPTRRFFYCFSFFCVFPLIFEKNPQLITQLPPPFFLVFPFEFADVIWMPICPRLAGYYLCRLVRPRIIAHLFISINTPPSPPCLFSVKFLPFEFLNLQIFATLFPFGELGQNQNPYCAFSLPNV